jgi:hypothetical protein
MNKKCAGKKIKTSDTGSSKGLNDTTVTLAQAKEMAHAFIQERDWG